MVISITGGKYLQGEKGEAYIGVQASSFILFFLLTLLVQCWSVESLFEVLEQVQLDEKMITSSLTWLDAFLSSFDNSLGHSIGRSPSVTGLFSLLAGSSFTEARPDAPVSPAVPIPRASEAHPETL